MLDTNCAEQFRYGDATQQERRLTVAIDYEIIVKGNSLKLRDGHIGLANLTLVFTPGGLILFDTGHYSNRHQLLSGLERRGLTPADIGTVFLSHLHFDHSNNIDLFPDAAVYVSKREWDYAREPHERDISIPWLIHEQLRKHDLRLVEGEGHLVDGVRYFPAPGHTPGSYALEIDSAANGRVIIAGDAIKYLKEAIVRRSDLVFDSIERSSVTIGRIIERADRIIPGHFPELIKCDGGFSPLESAEFALIIR